ncbi:MAG: hypothetical protein H6560_11545 [Lewinellaceae bacterium]|nr:hypothetical protein [Lewinellaceae bacterium]
MENKFLEKVSQALSTELPYNESMDDYLDEILPSVRAIGEDLREEHFYVNKGWLEFRDDEKFHDTILHFFNDGGEYLRSVNGDIKSGSWRFLEKTNKMMISLGSESELFDLAYMDAEFFILSKHGDQKRLKKRKYFVMAFEPIGKKLEWRNLVEKLYNKYRNSNNYYYFLAIMIVLIVILVVILSQ